MLIYANIMNATHNANSYKYISIARLCRIDYELFQHINDLSTSRR